MITVFNFENGTCNLISLVNTSGDVLSDFKTTQSTSDIGIVCSAVIDIPNSVSFKITIFLKKKKANYTAGGFVFSRLVQCTSGLGLDLWCLTPLSAIF